MEHGSLKALRERLVEIGAKVVSDDSYDEALCPYPAAGGSFRSRPGFAAS